MIKSQVNNSQVNTSLPNKRKNPFTQQPAVNLDNWTSEQMNSSEQMCSSERLNRGGGDQVESTLTNIYTYTAPQKNSVLKGLLPTSTNTRTVYHKMSVYDFSFMIPFILYSLKELRLGLQVKLSYEVAALWYAEYNT